MRRKRRIKDDWYVKFQISLEIKKTWDMKSRRAEPAHFYPLSMWMSSYHLKRQKGASTRGWFSELVLSGPQNCEKFVSLLCKTPRLWHSVTETWNKPWHVSSRRKELNHEIMHWVCILSTFFVPGTSKTLEISVNWADLNIHFRETCISAVGKKKETN